MNWKNILVGAGIGFAIASFIQKTNSSKHISSEKALRLAKHSFKKDGKIDGSWIHVIPETIDRFGLPYDVYRGGISRTVNNTLEQFEFLVDAKTGSIIEVSKT